MTKHTITTFEGWERITVSGVTGSEKNGDARAVAIHM